MNFKRLCERLAHMWRPRAQVHTSGSVWPEGPIPLGVSRVAGRPFFAPAPRSRRRLSTPRRHRLRGCGRLGPLVCGWRARSTCRRNCKFHSTS